MSKPIKTPSQLLGEFNVRFPDPPGEMAAWLGDVRRTLRFRHRMRHFGHLVAASEVGAEEKIALMGGG